MRNCVWFCRFFPDLMKNHRCHDVLLFCIGCHQRSNAFDTNLKQRLADECDAPLDAGSRSKFRHDSNAHKVKAAARSVTRGTNTS